MRRSRGYISRVLQLPSFDWLTLAQAQQCIQVLHTVIPDSDQHTKFEYAMEVGVNGVTDVIVLNIWICVLITIRNRRICCEQ